MENIIKVYYLPTLLDLKPAIESWKNRLPNSRLKEEEGQGVMQGYLLHYIIDEITGVDSHYVHYTAKVYKTSIKDINEGKSGLRDLNGVPATLPEKISLWSFLKYKDTPTSLPVPSSGEFIDCTLREYFLGDRLCAIALFSGATTPPLYDLGE